MQALCWKLVRLCGLVSIFAFLGHSGNAAPKVKACITCGWMQCCGGKGTYYCTTGGSYTACSTYSGCEVYGSC
jgi:hypothetical protein